MTKASLSLLVFVTACCVQPVAERPTADCRPYISALIQDHNKGTSCLAAKKHAEEINPECKIIFTCKNETK